jgi:hypothetical protein
MSITPVASRPTEHEPIVLKPSLTEAARPAKSGVRDTVTLSPLLQRRAATADSWEKPESVVSMRIDKVELSLAGRYLREAQGIMRGQEAVLDPRG